MNGRLPVLCLVAYVRGRASKESPLFFARVEGGVEEATLKPPSIETQSNKRSRQSHVRVSLDSRSRKEVALLFGALPATTYRSPRSVSLICIQTRAEQSPRPKQARSQNKASLFVCVSADF